MHSPSVSRLGWLIIAICISAVAFDAGRDVGRTQSTPEPAVGHTNLPCHALRIDS